MSRRFYFERCERHKIDIKCTVENCINWIKDWFDNDSGNAKGIIVGISGGKDSTVVAKLCAEAIGKENVFGVIMPNGEQKDIKDAIRACNFIGIQYRIINIVLIYQRMMDALNYGGMTKGEKFVISPHTATNIPPRLRMSILYAIGQEMNYRIAGTGNLSEHTIGYFTKHGDGACDFNPIELFTMHEVLEIGDELGLPYELVHKTPSDGLCGKTDEDNFGFTYEDLDNFIRCKTSNNDEIDKKIETMEIRSFHKIMPTPVYNPDEYYMYGDNE